MSADGAWTPQVERTLAKAFAPSQDNLAPLGLRLELVEVSWTEQRHYLEDAPDAPVALWRRVLDWLLARAPVRRAVRVSVRLRADGSVDTEAAPT